MGRWLTRPLEQLASGARQLFQTPHNADLLETGTREVRTLATAINELQHRIAGLMTARTQMLAAVSHDLRTPLTRLRLRSARLQDRETRRLHQRVAAAAAEWDASGRDPGDLLRGPRLAAQDYRPRRP